MKKYKGSSVLFYLGKCLKGLGQVLERWHSPVQAPHGNKKREGPKPQEENCSHTQACCMSQPFILLASALHSKAYVTSVSSPGARLWRKHPVCYKVKEDSHKNDHLVKLKRSHYIFSFSWAYLQLQLFAEAWLFYREGRYLFTQWLTFVFEDFRICSNLKY